MDDRWGTIVPYCTGHYYPTRSKSLRYTGSWVAKDYKSFWQRALFCIEGLVDTKLLNVSISLCWLLKLCFKKEIKMEEMDMYCKAVDRAVADFSKRILIMEPEMVNKMKLHLLSHLTDNIRRFGPLTLWHVEASERANGAVREAYTRTNRSENAGNQVANHFSIREALQSFLKFGEFYDDNQGRIIQISKGLEELKNLRVVKKVLSQITYIRRRFFYSYRNQVVYRQDKWFEVFTPTGDYDSFGNIILRPSNRFVDVANENELEPLEVFPFCSQHRTYDGSCCDTFDAVGNYYRIGQTLDCSFMRPRGYYRP
jgi:hypothetical protein